MFYTVKLAGNQTPATNLRQRHITPRSHTTPASVAREPRAALDARLLTKSHKLVSHSPAPARLAQQQQRASRSCNSPVFKNVYLKGNYNY